jgi:hypothetical protein
MDQAIAQAGDLSSSSRRTNQPHKMQINAEPHALD